jgi:hypothetical protein
MNRLFSVFFLVLTLIAPIQIFAGVPKDKTITLNLPESVLSQALGEMVPLEVDPATSSLQGSITVSRIEDLRITDQNIFCRLKLSGKNLHILTELAGHQINMKVGEIELNLNCSARLRYDSARQVLYIRPLLNDISSPKPSNTDIGGTLLPLLNDREFPITIKELEPLIAQTDLKTISIMMHISDIRAVGGALQLSITPKVSSIHHPSSHKKHPNN